MSLLLETVVGLGIFTVALLIIFGIFGTVGRSSGQARDHSLATHLARETLDRERSRPYASVDDVPLTVVPVNYTMKGVTGTTTFNVVVDVTEVVPGERKDVLVTVSWDEGTTMTREVRLETFVVSL